MATANTQTPTPLRANHQSLVYVELDQLRLAPRQTRKHGEEQILRIASSLERFGFVAPILIDGSGEIIAGHARVEAARRLELKTVPAIRVEHLSPEEVRAYRIADNRLAELSSWDDAALKLEIGDLIELDFDIDVIGFETAELDLLLDDPGGDSGGDPDDEPVEPEPSAVTIPGDVWLLGRHRLVCGDGLAEPAQRALFDQDPMRMVFIDPPYNVPVSGHVCGLGKVRHREFAMASGEMTEAEFRTFLDRTLAACADPLADGGLLYACMDWRSIDKLIAAGKSAGLKLINVCVWAKDNGGMGSFYRSQHELIAVFRKGQAPHINNVELGRHGRYRTNVWNFPGVNSLGGRREDELSMHPTVKPVALVAEAIKDCTNRGDAVFDMFGGSGTTLVAAERTGRTGYMFEIDPVYVDTIIRRFEKLFGVRAVHEASELDFEALSAQRANGNESAADADQEREMADVD